MKCTLWAATIGALLALPVFALAQQSADPADPRATVPAPVYESAVTATPRSLPGDDQVTPDKVWRAANDAVAGTAGHTGHVPAAQAAPAPTARPVAQPAVDHSKHH